MAFCGVEWINLLTESTFVGLSDLISSRQSTLVGLSDLISSQDFTFVALKELLLSQEATFVASTTQFVVQPRHVFTCIFKNNRRRQKETEKKDSTKKLKWIITIHGLEWWMHSSWFDGKVIDIYCMDCKYMHYKAKKSLGLVPSLLQFSSNCLPTGS